MLYVVDATWQHVRRLALTLRPADREEIHAATGFPPLAALAHSYAVSEDRFTVMLGSVPVGMFGVALFPGLPPCGWLVGTEAMTLRLFEFIRGSLPFFDQLLRKYGSLTNWVDERNIVHQVWLKRIGAEFGEVVPYGPCFQPFRRFKLERLRFGERNGDR